MALSAEAYLAQLQALLPQGAAWPREAEATLTKLLAALAEELARVDARAEDLLDEADPRTAYELLADWERVAGLPDPCVTDTQSTDQRRAVLVARLAHLGGQSAAYFINIAVALGYPGATVSEFRPATCNDDCNDAIGTEDWRFAWRLNLPQAAAVFVATCNSTCNDALQGWGNTALECVVNRVKPAHTTVLFAYGG